jgi:protein-L-isoaspartate(D-aspartate) O-methyltransferase
MLAPRANERALEIGTGSGYLTACLATLARSVTSIDGSAERVATATTRIREMGITNCDIQVQDVYERSEADTFDVIAVTGSIRAYDPRFEQWLNTGGRAFLVIGTPPAMEACLITRTDEGVKVDSLFETIMAPLTLPGDSGAQPFRF